MLRISRYIIILSSFAVCFCINIFPQEKNGKKAEEEIEIALYQGLKVEVDAFSLAMSAFNKETYSFEGNVQVNLKEKYFPTLEMGLAGADKTSINDYSFKTTGLFTRIGVDYNLLKPNKPDTKIHKYFLIGVRYGFSHFSYDLSNITIDNGYWGDGIIRDFNDVKTTKHWFEVVAGLRVEVVKNIYMGWNVRLKTRLGDEKEGEVSPWFIPGIGIKSTGNWGFNYTIGYKF